MPETSASTYVPNTYNLDPAIVSALPAAVEKYYPGAQVNSVILQGMEKIGPKIVEAVQKAVAEEMAGKLFQGEMDAANTATLGAEDEDFIPPILGNGGTAPQGGGITDMDVAEESPLEDEGGLENKKNPSLKNAQNPEVSGGGGENEGQPGEQILSPEDALDEFGEGGDEEEPMTDRKSTRLNSSHSRASRMPSSA